MTAGITKKTYREEFAKFFEAPTREGLRKVLQDNIGEFPNLDFKGDWSALSKIAKHVLAMGNYGGGCIIVGIHENDDNTIEARGVLPPMDKADIVKGINKYLPNALQTKVELMDFSYEETEYPTIKGKTFQVIFVSDDPQHLPFVAMSDGDRIAKNTVYVRRGTSSEAANHDELQQVINRRIATGYSSQNELDLKSDLEQLKVLFGETN